MSRANIWMPFYIGPYLADTMHLTTEQHGAYFLLLLHYWANGPLPQCPRKLSGITRVYPPHFSRTIWPAIKGFFVLGEDGLWHNKRADIELDKASKISEQRRGAAKARYHGGGQNGSGGGGKPDANASANAVREGCEPRARARATTTYTKEDPSLRSGPAGAVPPAGAPRFQLWSVGLGRLRDLTGAGEREARRELGRLLRDARGDCDRVLQAILDCPVSGDALGWIAAAAKPRGNSWFDIVADGTLDRICEEIDRDRPPERFQLQHWDDEHGPH